MALQEKAVLYNELKLAREMGLPIPLDDKPYVNYTVAELAYLKQQYLPETDEPATAGPVPPAPGLAGAPGPLGTPAPSQPQSGATGVNKLRLIADLQASGFPPQHLAEELGVPLEDRPEDRAGLNFNTHEEFDPIRVDSQGMVWFQDEVIKPAIPKSRARRVINYKDPGVKEISKYYSDGRLDETFEVAGDEARDMQIKVTLPSWQVGIYKDRRLPFRVHIYNGIRGFSWRDVVIHYGGMDLVPSAIKRIYVGNDLCFDIKSTRDQMDREYQQLQLQLQAGRAF